MAKRVVAIALVALIVLGGVIAYAFLKSPAEASVPIQAIPLAGEPTGTAAATATTPAVATPATTTTRACLQWASLIQRIIIAISQRAR